MSGRRNIIDGLSEHGVLCECRYGCRVYMHVAAEWHDTCRSDVNLISTTLRTQNVINT